MKSDSPVKKHHFWILFGVVPLVTLIGVLMVDAKVGGKIDARQKEIDDAKASVAGKTPKPEKLIAALEKVATRVEKKQGELHKENWDRQKALFTWPRNSEVFKRLEERELPFGSDLPDLGAIFEEFRKLDTYKYEYSSSKFENGAYTKGTGMADLMAPTQFLGGWQGVLRYVNDFGQVRITKDQVWLLLEDMWVQRSLLSGLRAVNTELAEFHQVSGTDPAPAAKGQTKTKKLFRNRIWELSLEVVNDETTRRPRLTGTVTNISERLQLLGKTPDGGSGMVLNVWLSADPNAQPMLFKIGGDVLPGRGAMKSIKDKNGASQVVPANVQQILPLDDHYLPPGTNLTTLELTRVEQVYDLRTVPLKRIDALVIGNALAVDARSKGQIATTGLAAPLSKANGGLFTEAFVADPLTADPNNPGGSMGDAPGGMGPSPGGGPRPGGVGGVDGGPGGTGGAGTGREVGGGLLTAVADGNKKRYLAVTPQVRRMPVALVVVVDQAYMQDVLLSLSNSPLRFQITQVSWTRFRGVLDGLNVNAGGGGSENLPDFNNRIPSFGGGLGSRDDASPGLGSPIRPPGAGGTGIPPGMGSTPGSGPGGYPGFGTNSSVVTESQITAGLVELNVYGVVSLYEKPPAPAADPSAPTPNTPTPAPETPAPMPMVPNNQTPPKMRRRTRA